MDRISPTERNPELMQLWVFCLTFLVCFCFKIRPGLAHKHSFN